MYIHQLISPTANTFIYDETVGCTKLLTPEGAVFDSPDCDDFRNFTVASGNLFKNTWRIATIKEIEAFYSKEDDKMLQLVWVKPVMKAIKKNHLSLVKS